MTLRKDLPITLGYYTLDVGTDKDDKYIYQVTNRESGVVEYDDYILPRSFEAMTNLNDKLTEVYLEMSKDKAPLELVVKKGEGNDKGSLH